MTESLRHAAAIGVIVVLAGCAPGARYARDGGVIERLVVRAVEWNPTHAKVGAVRAVADDGDDVAVFGDEGVFIFRGGTLVANDTKIRRWRGAATVPALDGGRRWLIGIGVDDKGVGAPYRVRGRSSVEAVGERYGLASHDVAHVETMGGTYVGFEADGEVALTDGVTLKYLNFGTIGAFAAGSGLGAVIVGTGDARGVRLFDPRGGDDRMFMLPRAKDVAIDDEGLLVAMTDRAIYARVGTSLELAYFDSDARVHEVEASGHRVWFSDGKVLGVVEQSSVGATRVAIADTPAIADDTTLIGSASGDVWALRQGELTRFRVEAGGVVASSASSWERDIRPIFTRVCRECHSAGGEAGVELGTETQWRSHRAELQRRVLDDMTMPPRGHSLTTQEVAAITAWLRGP